MAVCPEAVAIDAIETSKTDRRLADIVEDLIKCEFGGALKGLKRTRFLIFRFVIPNRRAGALPYLRTAILSRIISH
jgi:hypothetical protein